MVSLRRRQHGVALITALLVVALATVAAVAMSTRQHVDVRRTANVLHGEQAYAYAVAAESWAQVILRRDANDSNFDALSEDWATALPPIAVEGGYVNGRVLDLQGRFNLNNIVDSAGAISEPDLNLFRRLLELLDIDPLLAPALVDWIDPDISATFPGGAEDDAYLLAEPPYRAANRPLTDVSELLLVKGFTSEYVGRLTPHVSALPGHVTINVNTATPLVLQALENSLDESAVAGLLEAVGEEGFDNINDFLALDELAGLTIDVDIGVSSNWFSVLTDVVVGTGHARLDSHLQRASNDVSVISRTRVRSGLQPVSTDAAAG